MPPLQGSVVFSTSFYKHAVPMGLNTEDIPYAFYRAREVILIDDIYSWNQGRFKSNPRAWDKLM